MVPRGPDHFRRGTTITTTEKKEGPPRKSCPVTPSQRESHNLCTALTPPRRTGGVEHASASDAARHHCNMHGEALRQQRFLCAALQKARAVQNTGLPASPGHMVRLAQGERRCAKATAILSFIKVLATYHPLAPRGFSRSFWDVELEPSRADRMRGSFSQVCRPGIVAARSEHRTNPLDHLEKVRDFAMRCACTHP